MKSGIFKRRFAIPVLSMRTLSVTLIILLVSCDKSENEHIPSFSSNGGASKIFEDLRPVTRKYDFTFTFFIPSGVRSLYTVLGLKGKRWERIEIRTADFERDSVGHTWILSTTRTRSMDSTEVVALLNLLRNGHAFDLPEESTPLKKCLDVIGERTFPDAMDAQTYFIQMVAGNKVRTLKYYDPERRRNKCPDIPEWGYMLAIEKAMAAPAR